MTDLSGSFYDKTKTNTCRFFVKSFALLFFVPIFAVPNKGTRGVAQLASASGLGPEGPVFESQYPDIQKEPAENQQVLFLLSDSLYRIDIIDKFGGVDIPGDETAAMN